MSHLRSRAAAVAHHTVEVVSAALHTSRKDGAVRIHRRAEAWTHGTLAYPPGDSLPRTVAPGPATVFETVNGTRLHAARKLVAVSLKPAAPDLASARNPGCGFLGGARAPDASPCRASALGACISGDAKYRDHAHLSGRIYTSAAVCSPAAPLIKDPV